MNPTEKKDGPATPARKKNPYPLEFRRDSVAAWRLSGLSIPKYADQIGVHCTTLYAWVQAEGSPLPGVAGGGAPTGPRTVEQLERELQATRAELQRVQLQRDILKKTLGIVCEPSPSATPASPR